MFAYKKIYKNFQGQVFVECFPKSMKVKLHRNKDCLDRPNLSQGPKKGFYSSQSCYIVSQYCF